MGGRVDTRGRSERGEHIVKWPRRKHRPVWSAAPREAVPGGAPEVRFERVYAVSDERPIRRCLCAFGATFFCGVVITFVMRAGFEAVWGDPPESRRLSRMGRCRTDRGGYQHGSSFGNPLPAPGRVPPPDSPYSLRGRARAHVAFYSAGGVRGRAGAPSSPVGCGNWVIRASVLRDVAGRLGGEGSGVVGAAKSGGSQRPVVDAVRR